MTKKERQRQLEKERLRELKQLEKHNALVIKELVDNIIEAIPRWKKRELFLEWKEKNPHRRVYKESVYVNRVLRCNIILNLLNTHFGDYMANLSFTNIKVILDINKDSVAQANKMAMAILTHAFKERRDNDDCVSYYLQKDNDLLDAGYNSWEL